MTDETADRRAPGQSTADRPQAPKLPQQPPPPAGQQPPQPSSQPQPQPPQSRQQPAEPRQQPTQAPQPRPPVQPPPASSNGTQAPADDEKAKIRSATRDLSSRPEAPADVPEPQDEPATSQTAQRAQATDRAQPTDPGQTTGADQTGADQIGADTEPTDPATPNARATDPATDSDDGAGPETPPEAGDQTAPEAGDKAARQRSEQERPTGDGADGGGAWAAWRRIREGILPSRGQAIVGLVLGLVAFMAVVQVRQNLADDGYANARREDLIEILDGLGQSSRRLESEITDLQERKAQLSSGANQAETARTQAEQQIKVLGILAGTLPAQGPGVRITLNDPNGKVESGNLLDAIEELRDAGAEAIQINGRARVVASTDFTDDPPGIRIDGERLQPPYVIEAIGDSHTLSEAAQFPGGLVSEVTGPQINGTADVKEVQTLRITALHTPQQHRYARPAASPTK
jgi:uncharacterized protein YlxW (UPF0749 family)